MNGHILLISILVLVVGCASSSPIQRVSESSSNFSSDPEVLEHHYSEDNVYRIYHRAATGYVSIQSIRQSAEHRAEQFASRQGKSLIILGERTSNPPFILGNFPRIEIIFALIDKNDGSGSSGRSKYDQIEQLKRLFDSGAITEKEYETEKTKILGGG